MIKFDITKFFLVATFSIPAIGFAQDSGIEEVVVTSTKQEKSV